MRFSLRLKLFVVFVLISVLLLWMVTSSMIGLFESDKKTYIFDLNVDIAINLSKQIDTYISSRKEDMKVVADIIDSNMALSPSEQKTERLDKIIKIIFDQYETLIAFLLFSEKSLQTQVYNKKVLNNASLSLEDFVNKIKEEPIPFDNILQGNTYIRNITISPKLPSVLLAIPYQMNSLKNPVVLLTILSTKKLSNWISQSTAFEAYLVDNKGRIVVHSDINTVVENKDFSNIDIVKQLLKRDTSAGTIEYSVNKKSKFLGAYSAVEETGLGIIVQRPYEVAIIALKQLKDKSLTMVIYMFFVALAASLLIAQKLTKPLEQLTNIAKEIGKGNYLKQVNIKKSRDEIGDLAETFIDMSIKLDTREKEIRSTYEKLVSSEKMATCYLVGQKVTSILDLEKVFDMSVKYARELGSARASLLLEYDDKFNRLTGKAGTGIPGKMVKNFIFKPNQAYLKSLNDKNFSGESDLLKKMLIKKFNMSSFITVPLTLFDRIYGLLILVDKQNGEFTTHDYNVLNLFAAQCSIACANARLYKETEFMAVRDGLTGLYNRRYFNERAKEEFNSIKRAFHHLSYLLIDIDFFKKVNDTYGHLVGDIVLKDVAKILTSAVRRSDIVVRYGGEEMIIVLTGTDKGDASRLAERIRLNMEENKIAYDGGVISITVSIGVSSITDLGQDYHNKEFNDLIKCADQALYKAKENGRNRIELYKPNLVGQKL